MLFLLLLPLGLQEETAEQAFQRLEKSIVDAKSVDVRYTYEAAQVRDGKETKIRDGKGEILMKGPNNLRFVIKFAGDKNESSFFFLCDGKRLKAGFLTIMEEMEAPADARSSCATAFARAGIPGIFMNPSAERPAGKPFPGRLKASSVSDLKFGEAGKGSRSLKYSIPGPSRVPLQVTLWYSTANGKLLGRTMEDGQGTVLRETYTEMLLDSEISDRHFRTDEKEPPTLLEPPAAVRGAAASTPVPEETLSTDEVDRRFIRAKMGVAREHLKKGFRDKAVEILEDIVKTYPKHVDTREAQKLLAELKK